MGESAETKTFKISDRCSVTITVGIGGYVSEWDPKTPGEMGGATDAEKVAYYAARHEMLSRLAVRNGMNIAVIDL